MGDRNRLIGLVLARSLFPLVGRPVASGRPPALASGGRIGGHPLHQNREHDCDESHCQARVTLNDRLAPYLQGDGGTKVTEIPSRGPPHACPRTVTPGKGMVSVVNRNGPPQIGERKQ